MASIHLLLALVVGLSETCATNGTVLAGGAYAEAVRKAGGIPVVICRTAKPEDLDRIVEGLDLLIATGGEDVDPARYGETPSPHLGRVNAVRDEFEEQLLRAAVQSAEFKASVALNARIGGSPCFICFNERIYNAVFKIAREIKHTVRHAEPDCHTARVLNIAERTAGAFRSKLLLAVKKPHCNAQTFVPGFHAKARRHA